MFNGKPIIASKLPNIEEILKHEINALLCRHDNINDWVNALEKLKNDPEFKQKSAIEVKPTSI